MTKAASEAVFFASAAAFRAWLERHHADRGELLVGFQKKRAKGAPPSHSYAEAVDDALCFGWIDGVRRSIDATRYEVRFTPRKAGSIWSRVNVAHVERLTREGRMRPAGLAAFEARTAKRTGVYSFEQERPSELDPARAAKLRADRAAHAFFEAQPPSYRRTAAFWVMSAKKDETRDRRLASLIESSAAGRWAPPFAFGTNAPGRKAPGKDAPGEKAPGRKARRA